MPINVNKNVVKYLDPNTGTYKEIDAVGGSGAKIIEDITGADVGESLVVKTVNSEGTPTSLETRTTPLYISYSTDARILFEAASQAMQTGSVMYILDNTSGTPCPLCDSELNLETDDITYYFSAWSSEGNCRIITVDNANNSYAKSNNIYPLDAFTATPDMIAPIYSAESVYNTNNCVRHQKKLYRRKADNHPVAESWDPSHWDEIQVCSDMQPQVQKSTIIMNMDWQGEDPYYASITYSDKVRITPNTKIDIQPTPGQIAELQDAGVTMLQVENRKDSVEDDCIIWATGNMPEGPMSLQCTLTELEPVEGPKLRLPYLEFSSDEDEFHMSTDGEWKYWDGSIFYSTDRTSWNEWDGSTIYSDKGKLYLRGTDNTRITGAPDEYYLRFIFGMNTGEFIDCTGSIETLLDWETYVSGGHPEMSSYCFAHMFYQCQFLRTPPELTSTTLSNYCYEGMFQGCTSLTTTPELPAMTLASHCYEEMFQGCTSLTTATVISAMTMAEYSCFSMFKGCTSLTTPPELPVTTLANECYEQMFSGCTSLTTSPELPATTLANDCYNQMFFGCTSLITAPELPATTLAAYCYNHMFYECTNLTTAPELPATTVALSCYSNMFQDCTSLTTPPELPATTLDVSCYSSMFSGCTSLTTAPELPATTLVDGCYVYMFQDCTSLKLSETQDATYQYEYRIPTTGEGQEVQNSLESMFAYTGGTFTGTPSINTTYYTDHQPVG